MLLATATPVQIHPIEAFDLLDALGRPKEASKVLGDSYSITLSNITPHSVTVSWTPTGAGIYEVQCCTADDFNTLPLYDIGTIDTSYTFGVDQWNGPLAPETQYYVRVAPDCPEGGYEPWSEVITFTTPEACPLPTNLTITDVTPHGFMATFEPGGDWQTTWHFNTTTTNEPPIYASGTTLAPDITYPEFLHLLETNTHYYLNLKPHISNTVHA